MKKGVYPFYCWWNYNKLVATSAGQSNFILFFLAWSTFLETVYVLRLDAVQKTIKAEKNVNELSGSPGKYSFEYYQNS